MAFIDPTQREIMEEQKQFLKGKSFKYKIKYFIDYYLVSTLLILGAVGIVVSIAITMILHKANGIQVLFINSMAAPNEKAFEEYSGMNTSKYTATFDDNYIIDFSLTNDSSYINVQKMIAVISAKDGDVIVGDFETVSNYSDSEFFADLRTVFSEEELASMGDKVIWHDFVDEEGNPTGESAPIFIDVSGAKALSENGCYNDDIQVVYSVIINSQRTDMAKAFYYFLYK